MTSLISFILIISFLIFIHELGHLLAAKWANVKVEDFSIGFGPKIFSFDIGETKYSLSLLPLGGYVKMQGEDISEIKDSSETEVVDPKRSYKNIPNFIQLKRINELMNLPDTKTVKGIRDKALLEIFYATGIRLIELVNLDIGSVDHRNNFLKVLGKGNKERIVPFGIPSKSALEQYLNKRGHSWESDPHLPLFVSSKEKRISKRTVQYIIGKYLKIILNG